jgi:hypothetical protein
MVCKRCGRKQSWPISIKLDISMKAWVPEPMKARSQERGPPPEYKSQL